MLKSILIPILILVLVIALSLVVWHFFFSIYEVKYSLNFSNNSIKTNSKFVIESYGLNSLGQKLGWRKINNSVKILEGDEFVKEILVSKQNQIIILTNSNTGKIILKVESKFSLNPAIFTFLVED